MFSQNLDLIINLADRNASGRLTLAGSKVVDSTRRPGILIRNDAGAVRLRACIPSTTGERDFDDVDLSAATVKIALGAEDRLPTAGTFALAPSAAATEGLLAVGKRYWIVTFVAGDSFTNVGAALNASGVIFTASGTTPTTWTNGSSVQELTANIAIDADADDVATALNATAAITAAGGLTVALLSAGAYQVTFTRFAAKNLITGPINVNMTPLSIVSTLQAQAGTSTLHEVQLIRLIAKPYCSATLSTAFPVAAAQVTTVQTQTADLPNVKRLTLNPQPYAGPFQFTLDTKTYAVPYEATGKQIQDLLPVAYTVIRRASNAWDFSGAINTSITLSATVTNLSVPIGVTGVMPLNTIGMVQAFAATEAETIRLLLEIEIQFTAQQPQKFFQELITVHRDLIDLSF